MTKVCSFCGASYPDANVFCPTDGTTLRAADTDSDIVGSVVADRYLVTDLLGEGGMGKVYRARHVRLPQEAAIKVLHAALVQDPGAVARLKSEASNASRISHDRVARVFDFGETTEGIVYLAMEYVPGRTLKRVLADGGPLEPARAAMYVRQIAEGLDAAHRLGIVHRDLKPDNVMVVDDGDGVERLKIVDFGIAKALTADAGEAQTRAGFVVGTPEFMSPEQLVGAPIDGRSDVYALALVSYQCLTGALPFDTSSPEQTITARLVGAPQRLAAAAPDVDWPPAVQDALDVGMARDPAQRPATAGAFARQLGQAIDAWVAPTASITGATQAAPPSHAASPAAPSVTPSATLATALPSASARATPPVATSGVEPSGPRASQPAAAPRRASSGALRIAGLLGGMAAVAVITWLALGGRGSPSEVAAAGTPPEPPATIAAPAGNPSPPSDTAGTRATLPAPPPAPPPANAAAPAPAPSTPAVPAVARAADSLAAGAVVAAPPERAAPLPAASNGAARTLDSITQALSPDVATPEDARAALPALRALMPRLRNGTDSVWAEIRQVDAYLLLQDADRACEALSRVRGRTLTVGQSETVRRYTSTLGCAP